MQSIIDLRAVFALVCCVSGQVKLECHSVSGENKGGCFLILLLEALSYKYLTVLRKKMLSYIETVTEIWDVS